MREVLEAFILENDGDKISDNSWRIQTPKRVIPMKKVGDLLASSLVVVESDDNSISCYLPLGEVDGKEVSALVSDMVDLPARINGRAALLLRPTDEGTLVLSLGNSFYLNEAMQEESIIQATLLSLLDSLADLVAEMMIRSDVAFQKNSKNLWLFLKEQASMSIILEEARKTSGRVEVAKTDLDIGKIQKELHNFTESLSPKERDHLEKLTAELKKEDPLSITEAEFREELHNIFEEPPIISADEATRAKDDSFLIVIYDNIKAAGPITYQYALVIYDCEKEGSLAPWHSQDVRNCSPKAILALEKSQSGSYIGLFEKEGHRNLFPTDEITIEEFKEVVTPIAKDFLKR